ncbi:hypothetical protein BpHYR1_047523 [Brachionus plicatilis]|uniref:Uncharacterized protein n=1 Tax=Brachionus plicatilis TaxID=10195 RepID=A0A3M7RKP6_BRAPC|nr:hypothetical protein BpHYR1_047523 [Brachionus plicatilis]
MFGKIGLFFGAIGNCAEHRFDGVHSALCILILQIENNMIAGGKQNFFIFIHIIVFPNNLNANIHSIIFSFI